MYVHLILSVLLAVSMIAGADMTPGVTIKTRTTLVTSEARPAHLDRRHSQSIYVQGSRSRMDDDWEGSGLAPGHSTTRIEQCDLKRMIFLEHGNRVYDISPFPDEAAQRARLEKALADLKAGKLKAQATPPDAPTISIETVDTGERKEVSGFTLRHLRQTETIPNPAEDGRMGGRIETKDGWYLDLPSPEDCPDYRLRNTRAFTIGYLDLGVNVHPRFETKGNTSPALGTPIEETHTTKYGNGMSFVEKTELLELSRGPIDPKLFELPEGYQPALHTPNGGRDLMRPDTAINRLRAWWEYYFGGWYAYSVTKPRSLP